MVRFHQDFFLPDLVRHNSGHSKDDRNVTDNCGATKKKVINYGTLTPGEFDKVAKLYYCTIHLPKNAVIV